MSTRRWIAIAAGVVTLPVIACLGVGASIFLSFPTPQGDRIDGGSVVGVEAEGSYAWVVSTATGVVLVDAGMDSEAAALLAEIGDRTVHAILVTHGHLDHVGGLDGFPDAQVIVGPGEAALVRGEELPQGPMQIAFRWVLPTVAFPGALREAADGEVLEIDDNLFQVVHLPGHTPGSAAYLWRDVAFTGDSLLGHGERVAPVHWAFATDFDQNVASLSKLLDHDFDRIADGHAGLHPGARAQLEAYLSP